MQSRHFRRIALTMFIVTSCTDDKTIDDTIPQNTPDLIACTAAANDYQPRDGVAGDDEWPACISDDDTWHPMGTSTSAAARVITMISMSSKLWAKQTQPTTEDFQLARDEYSIDGGLASRVGRRQDVTYPELPGNDKFACSEAEIAAANPDRCAGPGKLKPIIDDAFLKGLGQDKPRVQAARIEAGLLWFLYLSMTSEVWTCANNNILDCDSMMGYYAPTTNRSTPTGLAGYVNAIEPEAHQRIFDAMLAVRCWRDVDSALPPSNTGLYERSLAQVNKTTLYGMALILWDRIGKIGSTTGEAQEANIEFVKVIGNLLDHSAQQRNADKANSLKNYTSNPTADATAITKAQTDIFAIYNCP